MNFTSNIIAQRKIDPRLKSRMMRIEDIEQTVSVIIFAKNLNDRSAEEKIYKLSGIIKYKLPLINAYAVELPYKVIEDVALSKDVVYISDDVEVYGFLDIAAPAVNAPQGWNEGYTGKGITIAFLDTGIYPHPDLTQPHNRIIGFKDFINGINKPYDDNGHGTHVAGDAAGNGLSSNGKYKGIAPEANLVGVKVLNEKGSGKTSDIVAGMQWVVDNKDKYAIRIMSLSLGSSNTLFPGIDPMIMAVKAVWDSGIVVVAAAGNDGPKEGTITAPGISPVIITVGAVDDKGTISTADDIVAPFSSRGSFRRCTKINKPDVVAPGVNITSLAADTSYIPETIEKSRASYEVAAASTQKKGIRSIRILSEYKTMSGTSFATPIVSGAISLILQKHPSLSPDNVKKIILASTNTLKNQPATAQGKGMIDIKKMLAKADA